MTAARGRPPILDSKDDHGFDAFPGWRRDTAVWAGTLVAALVVGFLLRELIRRLWADPDWPYIAFLLAAVCVGAVPLVFK